MKRSALIALLVVASAVWGYELVEAATYSRLIPEPTAATHGLTRAWFSQIQIDSARGRISHIVLDRGTLFVQTDQAVLHAIDAETGRTLWARPIGRRGHPSLTPGANEYLLAVVNGSYLYIVNRFTGKLLWSTQIDGAPGAGAALSNQRVYVPTVTGLVYSYRLHPVKDALSELGRPVEARSEEERVVAESERRNTFRLRQEYVHPLATQSSGRTLVQPLITRDFNNEEFVAWTTDRGFLYVASIKQYEEDKFPILYKLETQAPITSRPTYLPYDPKVPETGVIYAASQDGYVHALNERDGMPRWRFSTGEPLIEPAVVVGWRVFAATQLGGMYCLDAKTGQQKWWIPQAAKFLSASGSKVYATDKLDRLIVLDAKSGSRFDTIPIPNLPIRLSNIETDRIYLASEDGLIQCLHEIDQTEPIQHAVSISQAAKKQRAENAKNRAEKPDEAQPPLDPEADPFGNADPFGGDQAEDPFAGGGDAAAEEEKPAEDPFGGGGAAAEENDDPFGEDPFG